MKTKVVFSTSGMVGNTEIEIAISDATIERLFNELYEWHCPICKINRIDSGDLICCNCLTEATARHRIFCGCLDADENDEAR